MEEEASSETTKKSFSFSPDAVEFIPKTVPATAKKPRKSKKDRACPRKRKKNKSKDGYFDEMIMHDGSFIENEEDWLSLYAAWIHTKYSFSSSELSPIPTSSSTSSIAPMNDSIVPTSSEATLDPIPADDKPISPLSQAPPVSDSEPSSELAEISKEQRKYSHWAAQAAEHERQRRINHVISIDQQCALERECNGRWAIEAIEIERQARITHSYLTSLGSTNWFLGLISKFNEDYELVCPNYMAGCRATCRRSSLFHHLTNDCEHGPNGVSRDDNPDSSYEHAMLSCVICPNAILGCCFEGCRGAIIEHLLVCNYRGVSHETLQEERREMIVAAISACEEERGRRVRDGGGPGGIGGLGGSIFLAASLNNDKGNEVSEVPSGSCSEKDCVSEGEGGQGVVEREDGASADARRRALLLLHEQITDEIFCRAQRRAAAVVAAYCAPVYHQVYGWGEYGYEVGGYG